MDPRLLALNETGHSIIEPLTKAQVAQVNEYLLSCSVFADAHVPQTARNRGETSVPRWTVKGSECVCVHNDDVLLAPYLLERALELTDIAADYVDRDPPTLYSANAFWTRPGTAPLRDDIQAYHRDQDDASFLVMFVFLTDVLSPDDGPQDLQGPDGVVRSIYGPAGTVFLADTSRMHRGRKPRSKERGLLWFRWGSSDRPAANEWDQIQPVDARRLGARYPSDPRLRESLRLLVV